MCVLVFFVQLLSEAFLILRSLMCIDLCIVVINEEEEEEEEEEPTRWYLVFYYYYDRLNMFRAALCPSSGAHGYISDCHMDRLIRSLQPGHLASQPAPNRQPSAT
jgi:hypothetical protein